MRARRALLALLAATTACIATAHVSHAQAPAPGVEYLAALRDALDAMPPGNTDSRSDPQLQRVRAPLSLARDRSSDATALTPIFDDLDRDPADLADARTRLQTLLAAFALPPNSVANDPHAALGTLHDVYTQDQFAGLGQRAPSEDFFSRFGRGILDVITWIASHTVGAIGLVPTLILVGLLIAGIVAFVVLRLQRAGTRTMGGGAAREPTPHGLDADAEWRLAEEAAARSDHREAVRHAFRSALLAVAARGRLRVDAAWTTSELLARARGDADLVAALAPAAASFDQAWYSGRIVTAQDWEVARDRCQAVRRLAARRGALV